MDRLLVLAVLLIGMMAGAMIVCVATLKAASDADDLEEAYWAKKKEGDSDDTDI